MNNRTARLIKKATLVLDPYQNDVTVKQNKRAWNKLPWTKRAQSRKEMESILKG